MLASPAECTTHFHMQTAQYPSKHQSEDSNSCRCCHSVQLMYGLTQSRTAASSTSPSILLDGSYWQPYQYRPRLLLCCCDVVLRVSELHYRRAVQGPIC